MDTLPIRCAYANSFGTRRKLWYLPDELPHRTVGGPAYVDKSYYIRGDNIYKEKESIYCFGGWYHRHPKAGPAVEYDFEDIVSRRIDDVYCWFGKGHRPDGPAEGRDYIFHGRLQCKGIVLLQLMCNAWVDLASQLNPMAVRLCCIKKFDLKQWDLWIYPL